MSRWVLKVIGVKMLFLWFWRCTGQIRAELHSDSTSSEHWWTALGWGHTNRLLLRGWYANRGNTVIADIDPLPRANQMFCLRFEIFCNNVKPPADLFQLTNLFGGFGQSTDLCQFSWFLLLASELFFASFLILFLCQRTANFFSYPMYPCLIFVCIESIYFYVSILLLKVVLAVIFSRC